MTPSLRQPLCSLYLGGGRVVVDVGDAVLPRPYLGLGQAALAARGRGRVHSSALSTSTVHACQYAPSEAGGLCHGRYLQCSGLQVPTACTVHPMEFGSQPVERPRAVTYGAFSGDSDIRYLVYKGRVRVASQLDMRLLRFFFPSSRSRAACCRQSHHYHYHRHHRTPIRTATV